MDATAQLPQMQDVLSSQVKQVGYDLPSQTLYVQFHGGGLYTYAAVPPDVYTSFLKADSLGKYLGANIKGKFKYQKLS